jgi:3-oxoacyl-[acyl-carrier-protein] synthase II
MTHDRTDPNDRAIGCLRVSPISNLYTPDSLCDLNHVPNVGLHRSIDVVMSTRFGFGGRTAVLALGKAIA